MAARVILAGGGTAGHLFPAIAVGERLAEVEGTTVLLVAADSDRRNAVLADSGLPSAFVLAKPFAYRLSWQLVPSLAALLRSSAWAIALLRRFRPTVVFGTGGYVMAPVMVAAAFMRIPRVVHICDAYPDRAGQLLSRGAQLVTLAFPSAATHLHGRATRVTGVPVRRQILSANRAHGQELLGLRPDKFTVLVTGGSQGARSLNEALLAALPTLLSETGLQIVHLTGPRQLAAVRQQADGLEAGPPAYHCLSYLEQMGPALAAADLVVSRAGSSSIGEAAALAKPLILVPYPHAAGHQRYNAAELEEAGAAVVIPDKDLCGANLAEAVLALYWDEHRRQTMAKASAGWGRPAATRDIARILLQF